MTAKPFQGMTPSPPSRRPAAIRYCMVVALALHVMLLCLMPQSFRNEGPEKQRVERALQTVLLPEEPPPPAVAPKPLPSPPQPATVAESPPAEEQRPAPPRREKRSRQPARQAQTSPQSAPAAPTASRQPVITQPSLLPAYRNRKIEYPALARERGQEGTVLLDLCIDVSGQVKTVQIVRSSGHVLLDRAAAKAVQGWRFSPSTKDGIPVEGSLRLPVEFHLRQQQNAGGIFRMANGWAVGLHRAS